MITNFTGEFLISPIPLELSLNYCSHLCAYCFANMNTPDREADVKKIMSQLKNIHTEKQDLANYYLRNKYPVVISNRVDPFATSNYQLALPIIKILTDLGNPVVLQTKGGRGIDDVLEYLPKSVWYISMSMLDESIRKKIEPGAPTIQSRLELIKKLKDLGHYVTLAINPLVSEWIKIDEVIGMLKEYNLDRTWIGKLHINPRQKGNLSEVELQNLSDVLPRAMKKNWQKEDLELHEEFRTKCNDNGIDVYEVTNTYKSNYFQPYHDIYKGKTILTVQDFINKCWDEKANDDRVTFDEFANFILPSLPLGDFKLDSNLITLSTKLYKEEKIPSKFSYRKLLEYMWNTTDFKRALPFFEAFTYEIDNRKAPLLDESGNKIVRFNRNLYDYEYTEF